MRRAFECEVFASEEILRELKGLGDRLREKLSLPQMLRWNSSFLPLIGKMRRVRCRVRVHLSRDPKDDAYLSLALAARADFLVTGDKDLSSLSAEDLSASGLGFLSMVSPREFLERIGEE